MTGLTPRDFSGGYAVLGAGNTATFTWTTESFTYDSPAYLAIGFGSTSVNRLRLWKDDDGGGGANAKDLIIQFTTDVGPLASRTYTTVTGLVNGFLATELMDATAVNANGTVVEDVHDSAAGDGFASLSFDTVTANPRSGARLTPAVFALANPLISELVSTCR